MLIKKLFLNNFKKRIVIHLSLLLIVFLMIITPDYSSLAQANVREAIVKVYTVSNYPDYYNPWSMQGPRASSGSGCIIENNLILTNAHVVSNQTFLQVRKYGDTERYRARVVAVSHLTDLALLTVDEPEFFTQTPFLSFGELPEIQQEVLVYGFPVGGDMLSITKGVISRIEHQPYVHSSSVFLAGQIDAAINPGNSGGPVLVDGKIVGVVMQGIPSAQNIGYMVPIPVIHHFFADLEDGILDGYPSLGIGLSDGFYFKGEVNSAEIKIENTPFANISGGFVLNNNGLTISELESRDPNGSILINGELSWAEDIPSYQFIVKTSNLSLHHSLLKQFSALQGFSGNIESRFQIESPREGISNTELNGTFSIKNMGRGDISLPAPLAGNLRATIDFTDNTLSIEELKLFSGEGNGNLQGDIRFEELVSFMLNFKYQIPDLTIYSNLLQPESKISGNMALEGKATGNVHKPEITIDLKLSEFSLQDHQAEELTGKLVYEKGTLSIESFTLNNQDLKLTAGGKIIFSQQGKPEMNISYQLPSLAIKPLMETMDYQIPLSGYVEGNGNIQGIWPELKAKGSFKLEGVTYQDYPLGQGKVDFNIEPDQPILSGTDNQGKNVDNFLSRIGQYYSLNLEHLQLQNEMIELGAKGQAKMGEGFPFSLDIEFSHQEFNDMFEHFYPEGKSINRFLPSRITGNIVCSGNNDTQNILLTFLLIPQQGENNPASRLEAMLALDKDGLEISDFQLIQSEGSLSAEGRIAPDRSLDINFQATRLDLSTSIGLIAIDEEIKGIMDIKGLCSGTLEQPTISIIAKIEEGYFRKFNYENLESELIWDSMINQIEVKKLAIALEEKYQITAQGNIPTKSLAFTMKEELDLSPDYSDIPLDFQINMERADLNIIKVFWQDTFSEITGTADLKLLLTGTADYPVINGTIGIYQGMAHLADLPVQIGEINNTINIINNKVTIPSIPFIAYENRFSFSGGLELVRFLPDNLSFIIKNEDGRIAYQNILESGVDLGLIISNSMLSPQISGQVILSDGTLNINNLLQLEEGMHFASSPPSLLGNNSIEQLNVNIELAEPFKLKMNNAEIDISGKIVLNGSLLEPAPKGTLSLKKGYFIYFDKRFSILDGMVTINGINPDNIELNARANTNVQGVQININVLGNLLNPQILLSSQPVLKETEILSLLAFDRNIEGLSEGEIDQLLSQEMVNILFQSLQINLFRRFEREIAEGLGLEFLRISFNNHRNDDSYFFLEDLHLADLTLEVGKNIGDDLLITYSTPLDFHGDANLTLDYKLSPEFTFSTQLENFSFKKEDYKIKFGLELRF
jgi:S1-C subfamily serine protease